MRRRGEFWSFPGGKKSRRRGIIAPSISSLNPPLFIIKIYFLILEINSCYNNTHCGQHGKCKNLVYKYKCICNFMYTGKYCEKCKTL
jgi:hypothetical protein